MGEKVGEKKGGGEEKGDRGGKGGESGGKERGGRRKGTEEEGGGEERVRGEGVRKEKGKRGREISDIEKTTGLDRFKRILKVAKNWWTEEMGGNEVKFETITSF